MSSTSGATTFGASHRRRTNSVSPIQPSNPGSAALSNPESTEAIAISSNGSSSSVSSGPPTQFFLAANQVVNFGNNASVQVNQSRKSKKEKIGANYNSRMSLDLLKIRLVHYELLISLKIN